VTAAGPTSLTVAPEHGTPVSLTIDSHTVITVNDQPATAADVKVGDRAEARYDRTSGLASRIAIEREGDSSGEHH